MPRAVFRRALWSTRPDGRMVQNSEKWRSYFDAAQLEALAAPMLKNGYGQYLMQVLRERAF